MTRLPVPAIDRIRPRLVLEDRGYRTRCLIWTGAKTGKGYGEVKTGSESDGTARPRYVHILVYEAEVGPVSDGLQLDHLCRQRDCAEPSHLEPVTNLENGRRGLRGVLAPTHCPHGHEFTPENTYRNRAGHRACATCVKRRVRERAARRRKGGAT